MKPANQDIEIYRGDVFNFFFRVRDILPDGTQGDYRNLTGWTGKAVIRSALDASGVLATFVVTFADQSLYPGGVLLSLSNTITAGLTFSGTGRSVVIGLWDVELTNDLSEPNTFLTGNVTLTKDVS